MSGVRRGLAVVAAAAVVVVATRLLGLDPEPVRVVLLVFLLTAGGALGLVALRRRPAVWAADPVHPPLTAGRDAALQSHLRLLESHQTTRRPDAAVRDRLAGLADRALIARHGVRAGSAEGRALLGPELDEVLHGPVVRLTPRRLDQVLRQIEELT